MTRPRIVVAMSIVVEPRLRVEPVPSEARVGPVGFGRASPVGAKLHLLDDPPRAVHHSLGAKARVSDWEELVLAGYPIVAAGSKLRDEVRRAGLVDVGSNLNDRVTLAQFLNDFVNEIVATPDVANSRR